MAQGIPQSKLPTGNSRNEFAGLDPLTDEQIYRLQEGNVFTYNSDRPEGQSVEVLDVNPEKRTATIKRSPCHTPETVMATDLYVLGDPDHPPVRRASPIPRYYKQAVRKREEIADATPVDVYCMSINSWWPWRWKLMSWHEARPCVRESCETLIIDSGVTRYGTPEEVLDAAEKTYADYVVASDITGMEDETRPEMPDSTMESLAAFMQEADRRACADRVILPLQPPYGEFLDDVLDRWWLDATDYVAIGGLLTLDDAAERIAALHLVRDRLGDDAKIHALAPGTDPEVIEVIRSNPGLLDSLDVSTPERAVVNGKLPDKTWTQQKVSLPGGTGSSYLNAQYAGAIATQLAFDLAPEYGD